MILISCSEFAGPQANRAPRITSASLVQTIAGEPLSYTATASDPDGDEVIFQFSGLPTWLVATGATVAGTPATSLNSTAFDLLATDLHQGFDSLRVTVEVMPGTDEAVRFLVGDLLAESNLDTLLRFVGELSGELPVSIQDSTVYIASRHKNFPGNSLAADYLDQKLAGYGLTVYRQSFSETGENVYAVQVGIVYPDQAYLICAHYDNMPADSLAPGADDNASGTAAVLEAARLLSPLTTNYSVIYALWDEEEQGLLGSSYFAENAGTALNIDIKGVINIDMIGWDSDGDGTLLVNTYPLLDSQAMGDTLVWVNNFFHIGLRPHLLDEGGSDNISFWENGYSAIGVEEYYGVDFNDYYHTAGDQLDKFNVLYFARATRAAVGTLAILVHPVALQVLSLSRR